MTLYEVEVRGDCREVYLVEAKDKDDAWRNWEKGDLQVAETTGVDVFSVREANDD